MVSGLLQHLRSDNPRLPLVHIWENKQHANFPFLPLFYISFVKQSLHVPMSAKHNAPSGKDCPKQCDLFVWFMSHAWLLAFATVARPLNSNVCASGPTCCHPRLSNTDGTLSKPHSISCRCMRRPPALVRGTQRQKATINKTKEELLKAFSWDNCLVKDKVQ